MRAALKKLYVGVKEEESDKERYFFKIPSFFQSVSAVTTFISILINVLLCSSSQPLLLHFHPPVPNCVLVGNARFIVKSSFYP